jgi:hypothetical protein
MSTLAVTPRPSELCQFTGPSYLKSSIREQEEALADGAQQVNNVVHSFRLQSTQFDKKSFLTYLKARPMPFKLPHSYCAQGYMKAIKGKLQETDPERVEVFEKNVSASFCHIVPHFPLSGSSVREKGLLLSLSRHHAPSDPYPANRLLPTSKTTVSLLLEA